MSAARRKHLNARPVRTSRRDHVTEAWARSHYTEERIRQTSDIVARTIESLASTRNTIAESSENRARSQDRLNTSNRAISPLNR